MFLRCNSCKQRITCCPGCGDTKFILANDQQVAGPDTITTSASGDVPNNRELLPQPPTAFDLFCRDEAGRGEACSSSRVDDEGEGASNPGERKRQLAEAWLSADMATRQRYEISAKSQKLAECLLLPKKKPGISPRVSPRDVRTEARPCGKVVESSSQEGTSSGYRRFRQQNIALYRGKRGAAARDWKAMSIEEKKPYEEGAATFNKAKQK
uniref:Uncharacterized protein n=1 Tax=Trypanosoma congolense (strain IL3000) TaxID=1068625 RepID=G0UV70_TRYCI|nr:conserved hypothetical protein [Trypanosoma congolense IL3000]